MKLPLLLLACAFALLAAQPACGSPSLSEVAESLALLEASGEARPSSSSVSEAEAYAADKLKHAQAESTALLDAAAKDGKKMAEQLEAKAAHAQREQPDGAPKQRPAAAAAAPKPKPAAAAKPDAPAKQPSAPKPKLSAIALRALRKARGLRNQQGVYGAVDLGASLSDSAPSSKSAVLTPAGSAVRQVKRGEKDIYGSPASCLKDIAAHFDEKDIYESKKNTLKRKLEEASDRTVASKLRNQLANLEMWHQSMQKKFLMSALEAKQHRAKMMRLLDENLPKDLKDQLKANQIAKRAAQKIPFPDAQRKVAKFMRANRKRIQQRERLRELGHKVMVRPIIDNPAFPSMDPITSHLREKQWRRVMLDDKWSTDKGDLEVGQNLVKAAFKQHGDFVNGPIAEPMLKGKLYNAKTEPLGVPNFLLKFPWPMDPNGPVSMDEKVKVEQTDYTTW